jgi:Family of unknown function (DUF5684)
MTSIIPLLSNSLLALLGQPLFLAQDTESHPSAAGAGIGLFGGCISLLVGVVMIAAMWKIFTKAGQPGWASIIPIYNFYVLCKVVGRPGWWVILMLIPFVNFIIVIIVCIDLAKSFGRGVGFGIGIIILGIIFLPILGFGDAQYQGAATAKA